MDKGGKEVFIVQERERKGVPRPHAGSPWPVLISRATEGRRLIWPGWLVTYRSHLKMGMHPSTNRAVVCRPRIELTTSESQV